MTLVERGGSARSFDIDATTLNEVTRIVRENVHHETIVIGGYFLATIDTVNHTRYEYVRDSKLSWTWNHEPWPASTSAKFSIHKRRTITACS